MRTFILIICFNFINFSTFLISVLFELIYLHFIIVKIYTFYLHCPLYLLFILDLIQFDVVFASFIQLIKVFSLIFKLFE
jgi:hypothetical protein